MNQVFKGFASDNNATVHPCIMEALAAANAGHCLSYGDDRFTAEATQLFKEHFGAESETFFVFNGTGANVLSLQAMTRPYEAVICAATAHINMDECGAPERFTGCKLLPHPTADGKLTTDDIAVHLHGIGEEHHVQPHAVSISQCTEMGTVYTCDELQTLSAFAHSHGLLLHVDGARLANAAVTLGVTFKEMIADTGVDILSFGGTKNGLMYGEAVVILNPAIADGFKYIRKQCTQLSSKMRYIAAQFIAAFKNDLWMTNAAHSNRMAQRLRQEAEKLGVKMTQKTQANSIFAVLPPEIIADLQKERFFYIWDEAQNEVRWVCSWDTTEDDVDQFIDLLRKYL